MEFDDPTAAVPTCGTAGLLANEPLDLAGSFTMVMSMFLRLGPPGAHV